MQKIFEKKDPIYEENKKCPREQASKLKRAGEKKPFLVVEEKNPRSGRGGG